MKFNNSWLLMVALLLALPGVLFAQNKQFPKDPGVAMPGGPSNCDAVAGNLVANCGFETGMITPEWTWGGDMSFTGVDGASAHSGLFGTFLGPVGTQGTFTQTLPTTAGGVYTLSFWLGHDGGPGNNFSASWEGTTVYSHTTPEGFPYMQVTIDGLVASADGSDLQFSFLQIPAYYHLDDITVVQTAGASE